MQKLIKLFLLYKPFGLTGACVATLRMLILPFWKIDKVLPSDGHIIDIGCGAGMMTNYLSMGFPRRVLLGIDMSKDRINLARGTVGTRKNIKFTLGDVVKRKFQRTNNFLMVDVLHHIEYQEQEKLLNYLSAKLQKNSLLVIKEVDNSNTLPFLFGHLWEKILYPHQKIYVRSKKEWVKIFNSLDLKYTILGGSPFFPDSSLVFICHKMLN